jgi:hypothetical protein
MPFDLLAPRLLTFSNILTMSVPDEGYLGNA